MEKYVFTDSVGFLTTTISRILQQKLQARFKNTRLNTTPEQWRLLVLISNEGEMNQSQLAELQHKNRAAIKRLIDHLENKKLVTRNSGKDSRSYTISLTQEGKHVVQVFNKASHETVKEALSCFSEAEAKDLNKLLNKLLNNIN
ncbi:transcriptional regulator, MarR family [Formosa agariphila KMM 3901]|uniref:Transcriptional regulator, MarR family n=1 Tax=Formosa agariphila (strain DSM 15362 / KCTC 12365 / LMG 23005 / KMM 3901 / M-2Alg 35-1) TaxID=1347342 RepID=T2KKS7_FORAG|nr:MarR family transcriptional regulator [Formosa agariphila]CDF79492.1 transcriptional regulator, MarR family [Formosa agariphila KMM 3901]